jgi:hypothetical protein
MNRFASLIVAAAFAATPAVAATYSAQPAVAPSPSRIIARDISWACGTGTCRGTTAESRPAVLCEGLAKRAGRLNSFAVDGRQFDAAALAKCNASVKGGASATLANAN